MAFYNDGKHNTDNGINPPTFEEMPFHKAVKYAEKRDTNEWWKRLASHPKFDDMTDKRRLAWCRKLHREELWQATLFTMPLETCLKEGGEFTKTFQFWMGFTKNPAFLLGKTEHLVELAKPYPHWYLWAKIAKRPDATQEVKKYAETLMKTVD